MFAEGGRGGIWLVRFPTNSSDYKENNSKKIHIRIQKKKKENE